MSKCQASGCANSSTSTYVISSSIFKSDYDVESYNLPQEVTLCDLCSRNFHDECVLCGRLMLDEWISYFEDSICRICIDNLDSHDISDELRQTLSEYESLQEMLETEFNREACILIDKIVSEKLIQRKNRELVCRLDNINIKKNNVFKLTNMFPQFTLDQCREISDRIDGEIETDDPLEFILYILEN